MNRQLLMVVAVWAVLPLYGQDNKEDVKLLQDETTNNKFMDSLVSSFLYINDHLI